MKRHRSIRSFFSPAVTPVMPTQSQINTNLNLSEEVETGASNIPNDVLTEMSVDAPVDLHYHCYMF